MKKINKLHVDSDKLMKNEELLTLRGGYGTCTCMCWRAGNIPLGYLLSSGDLGCHTSCNDAWGGAGYGEVGGYPVSSGCW